MDESTDSNDTAPVAIFIRGIDEEFDITEELAELVPLKLIKNHHIHMEHLKLD